MTIYYLSWCQVNHDKANGGSQILLNLNMTMCRDRGQLQSPNSPRLDKAVYCALVYRRLRSDHHQTAETEQPMSCQLSKEHSTIHFAHIAQHCTAYLEAQSEIKTFATKQCSLNNVLACVPWDDIVM